MAGRGSQNREAVRIGGGVKAALRTADLAEGTRPTASEPLPNRTVLDVEVDVEAPQELNHSSYALAGLYDLEHAGLIRRVRVVSSLDLHRGEIHVGLDGQFRRTTLRANKTTFITLRRSGRRVRLAVDFRDAASIFPEDGLQNADVLFKRSFDDHAVEIVAARYGINIEPAGVCVPARSPYGRDEMRLKANLLATSMLNGTRIDRSVISRWLTAWESAHRHISLARTVPLTSQLKPAPADIQRTSIFFQTRTFNRTDDVDANEIHEDRAALIRGLRGEFGPQFVGGFIPDDLSAKRYSDCLSTVAADKPSYYSAMNQAAIVIYTRGLARSAAWKLAEYMAHGKCIVGEEVTGRFAAPLRDNDTLIMFRSVDECIRKCHELLANPQRRIALEVSARRYYEMWVDPAAGMHRLLSCSVRLANL
jgi:hypothetical protein